MESRIRRSGGQVESSYSAAKVTHVMCDTQHAPCVEQAIRDGKRLVTVYWLDAVIKGEKKMRVPWRVIHLPRSPTISTCQRGDFFHSFDLQLCD